MSFDAFNEDLSWILAKLVARTGGAVGVISGQLGEDAPTLLASSRSAPVDEHLLSQLTAKAAGVPTPDSRDDHDNPKLCHTLLNDRELDGTSRRYRLLHLAFAPAEGVRVVATVAKESRLGFNFIEDATSRRLYPVLSRYIRLWWVHRTERRRSLALRAALDTSELGIMLLNRDGRLLFANSHGCRLLASHDGLTQEGNNITAAQMSDRGQFDTEVARALRANQTVSGSLQEVRVPGLLNLPRGSEKRDLILAVLPLEVPAIDTQDPAVIVYVLDPDRDAASLLAPVCSIYGLTATESRLAGELVSGYTVAEAAERIHVQPQTARAYLKSIFTKTKTHRQAELVRVMLSSVMHTFTNRQPH
jgi:DNA-binding CsgD family transcriptional regulator